MQKTTSATSHAGADSLARVPGIARVRPGSSCFRALWLTLAVLSSPARAAPSGQEFQRFLGWFEGEYDNYEQVWQQKTGDERVVLEHVHHIFKPVDLPQVGEHVFFVKQYQDGDPASVYRQRLYSFTGSEAESAIRLTVYSFHDEKRYLMADEQPAVLDNLDKNQLQTIPGCEVFWKWNGEYFDGYMKKNTCVSVSRQSGNQMYVNAVLRLTDGWLWIQDQAHDVDGNRIYGHDVPHKNRKVKFYKGWMALKKHRVNPAADLSEWMFTKIERMHNEGEKIPFLDEAGNKTGYTLSLETLTYRNTRVPVLKIGVIDDRTGYTLSYSWTDPASRRVGLNVRWFQAGLTRMDE